MEISVELGIWDLESGIGRGWAIEGRTLSPSLMSTLATRRVAIADAV